MRNRKGASAFGEVYKVFLSERGNYPLTSIGAVLCHIPDPKLAVLVVQPYVTSCSWVAPRQDSVWPVN
jgi:hypothetical protein